MDYKEIYRKAKDHLHQKKYDEAMKYFKILEATDHDDFMIYNDYADCLMHINRLKEAQKYITMSLKLSIGDESAYVSWLTQGQIYALTGNYELMFSSFERALTFTKDKPWVESEITETFSWKDVSDHLLNESLDQL